MDKEYFLHRAYSHMKAAILVCECAHRLNSCHIYHHILIPQLNDCLYTDIIPGAISPLASLYKVVLGKAKPYRSGGLPLLGILLHYSLALCGWRESLIINGVSTDLLIKCKYYCYIIFRS
jgi:hypothetical protein